MYPGDHGTRMSNPLLTIIESIRRLGGLRQLARGLPPVVQLAAAASTLALVAFSTITFVGGVIFDDDNGPPPTVTPTVTASPPQKTRQAWTPRHCPRAR